MTPKEAVALLVAAYRQEEIESPTVKLYESSLKDISPDLLAQTVQSVVRSSRFFPSIAEIRETAATLAGVLPPTAEEAMALVRQADVEEAIYTRDGEYRYTERYWRWPEDIPPKTIALLEHVISKAGDPVNGRNEERIFAWDTDFKRVYGNVAEKQKQLALADLSRAALPAARIPAAITDGR